MIDNSKEYILCAAIKRKVTNDCPKVYHKEYQDIYDVELGWRHCDILHRFRGVVSTNSKDQGFYTSKGRFVDRFEAVKIAFNCGQIDTDELVQLYSEDLY